MKRIRHKEEAQRETEALQEADVATLERARAREVTGKGAREETVVERLAAVEAPATELELEPDFTDQPLDVIDVDEADEESTTFFAPTDPVVTADARGRLEVLGGFSATAMNDVEVDQEVEGAQAPAEVVAGRPGDEALADAVRRELHDDALTTDLRIDVGVRRGVVYLLGTVQSLDDAENAEEVASRVPGVREVVERLTLRSA